MTVNQLCSPDTIKYLLDKHGFRFSKSMGQNFLIDSSVPVRIAEAADLDETVGVLEVGAGFGCLTAATAAYAGKVVCVELDTSLQPVLEETLEEYDNAEIVYGDVMKTDIKALVAEKFAGLKPVVCANLPYNITSPVITAFLESGCFETITVMIQKEVAKRMNAKPGTADYGAFTLLVQWYCETEILFDVSPSCFMPAPKVTSSVIQLRKRTAPVCQVQDEALMFKVIRAAFNQRRKTLNNALSNGFGQLTKQEIAECIAECGFDERIRGEALHLEQFAALADALAKRL